MDLRSTYNKIANDWHQDHRADTWWVNGTNAFIALLKKGDSVLDVGCGAGTKAKYLIQHGLRVTGMDFSEKMIEIARREVPEGKFVVADIRGMQLLLEKFNGIFMQAVLLHLPKRDIATTLKSATSRLARGGYVYIAVKGTRPGGPDEEIITENTYGYEFKRFFSYFTADEIKKYMIDVGLQLVYSTVEESDAIVWIQVIGKNKSVKAR